MLSFQATIIIIIIIITKIIVIMIITMMMIIITLYEDIPAFSTGRGQLQALTSVVALSGKMNNACKNDMGGQGEHLTMPDGNGRKDEQCLQNNYGRK